MSAYCDDDITATEPFFSVRGERNAGAQLVDLLFARTVTPSKSWAVWKLLRECSTRSSALSPRTLNK